VLLSEKLIIIYFSLIYYIITHNVIITSKNAIFNAVPQGVQVKYTVTKTGYTTKLLTYSAVTGGSGTSILNDIAFGTIDDTTTSRSARNLTTLVGQRLKVTASGLTDPAGNEITTDSDKSGSVVIPTL